MSAALEVDDLHVRFPIKAGFMGRASYVVNAVNGVSFDIAEGETLGMVGESGSGKSTIGRALLRLVDAADGDIRLMGRDVRAARGRMLDFRRDLQVIFQDPYSSLNPAKVIADIVGEPLTIHHGLKGRQRNERVAALLERVGLAGHQLERYPAEFSGGQRQRIAIARALALEPKVIVCDEPVSALDVSTQSQVINLLEELQASLGIAYLFIAHDLSVVRHISDRIAVMYLGRMVELGPTERVFDDPQHPYTQTLLMSVPIANAREQKARKAARRAIPARELPAPTDLPPGCPFHTRCIHATQVCREQVPQARQVDGGGWTACHLVD